MSDTLFSDQTPKAEEDDNQLEVHVIGANKGESIVVRLPSGSWGAVDCYTSSLDKDSPTDEFLKSRGATQLEFLCLTHPDEDHYKGMSVLVERYAPKRFWQFGGFEERQLVNLVLYVLRQAELREGRKQNAREHPLSRTLDLINIRRKSGATDVVEMSDYKILLREKGIPNDVVISCIGPSTNNIHTYRDSLSACFNDEGKPKPKFPKLLHNEISAALLIEYGQTRVILGGDMGEKNWREVLRKRDEWHLSLAAQLVKVSHHGSPTGTVEEVWQAHAEKAPPFAALTPFSARKLPKPHVVEAIRHHCKSVYTSSVDGVYYLKAQPPIVATNYDKRVQEGIRISAKSFQPRASAQWGCCSFVFDNKGKCQVSLSGPAGRLD